jgi:chromosome partitioning protein
MLLKTQGEIAEYLGVGVATIQTNAEYMPIIGINDEAKKSYVSLTNVMDFYERKISDITNGDFKSVKEVIESHRKDILEDKNLFRKKSKECQVITFNNLKGGVAKTTTVANLSAILASPLFNQRVLAVDMDMQNQLSDHFLPCSYKGKSIVQIIQDYGNTKLINEKLIKDTIVTIDVGNNSTIDVLPSEWALGNVLESARSITSVELLLKKILKVVKDDYDFILIDTPPTNPMALELSFFATDYVTFIVNAEPKSFDSFEYLLGEMKKLQVCAEDFNISIKLDSCIVTKYSETISSKEYLQDIINVVNKENLPLYLVPNKELFPVADSKNLAMVNYKEKRTFALEAINSLIDYAIDIMDRDTK